MCQVCVVHLKRTPPAVEKCSEGGCLVVSLLELLAFNSTFIFVASLVVLIEVGLSTNTLLCPIVTMLTC